MSDALETLLHRLADLREQAQRRWETGTDDDDGDYAPDGEVYLTLELDNYTVSWLCGWRVRPDEATVWVMHAAGNTPLAAAQSLLKLMEAPGD